MRSIRKKVSKSESTSALSEQSKSISSSDIVELVPLIYFMQEANSSMIICTEKYLDSRYSSTIIAIKMNVLKRYGV